MSQASLIVASQQRQLAEFKLALQAQALVSREASQKFVACQSEGLVAVKESHAEATEAMVQGLNQQQVMGVVVGMVWWWCCVLRLSYKRVTQRNV